MNFGVLQLFSFGGYGLALAALALVLFGAYDSYPLCSTFLRSQKRWKWYNWATVDFVNLRC